MGEAKFHAPIHHLLHDVQYQDQRVSRGLSNIRTSKCEHQKHHPQHQSIWTFALSWHVHHPTRIVSFKKKRKLLPNVSIYLESKANSSMHFLSPLSQDSNQNQHENKFLLLKFESMEHKLLKFWVFFHLSCPRFVFCELAFKLHLGNSLSFPRSANLHSNFSLEILFLLQTYVILLACIQTSFWKFFVVRLLRHVILWPCIWDFFSLPQNL